MVCPPHRLKQFYLPIELTSKASALILKQLNQFNSNGLTEMAQ